MEALDAPTIDPVHPRNHDRAIRLLAEYGYQKILLTQPAGYETSISLVNHAKKIVTDSGGTSTNNLDVWTFADSRPEDEALKGMQEATSNVYGNGHTAVYADMMDAITKDRPPYIDAKAGRRALEMILAMYQSAATGQPVKFPLPDVASTDITGRFDG